jgi:hypothetical protein
MNKERIKGIVIGFILCLTLSATVLAVSAQTVTRQVTYGVRVNLNGQLLHFADDMRPFVTDGRTFLPVRAISETLELPVDFDASTNTVYLGNRFAGQRLPLNTAAPFFDSGGGSSWHTIRPSAGASIASSVQLGGETHHNAIIYRDTGGTPVFTLHNLDGQYRMLTGYVGRVDGTHMRNATLNIFGDGNLLQTVELRAQDLAWVRLFPLSVQTQKPL